MDSKLTLKLDKEIIEQAKSYAKEHQVSLSKLIENYLQFIVAKKTESIEISPLVESLTGVINLEKEDFKKDYTKFLADKYS